MERVGAGARGARASGADDRAVDSAELVRDSRRALRADPWSLLERADGRPLDARRRRGAAVLADAAPAASLPVDVARTIEEALAALPLDVVHVHEPFAPSASSVALRHSRALNVAHLPRADRADPLDPARPAAVATAVQPPRCAHRDAIARTRDLMERFFPADYGGARPARRAAPGRPAAARTSPSNS